MVRSMILILGLISCDNLMEPDILLDSRYMENNKRGYNSVSLYAGTGQEIDHQYIFAQIDIGHPYTIVGDLSVLDWGFLCDGSVDNSCEIIDDVVNEDFLNDFLYKYKKAKLRLRFDFYQTDEIEHEKMEVRLLQKSQKWFLDRWGSVGLSPNSEIGNYLRKSYLTNSSFGLKFKLTKKIDVDNEELSFDSYILQNPTDTDSNKDFILVTKVLPAKAEFWAIDGDVDTSIPSFNVKAKPICFSSTRNEILLVPEPYELCAEIQARACNGLTGAKCMKLNANISKLSKLTFTFDGTQLSFEPEEYTFFDKYGKLGCRFGMLADLTNDLQCPVSAGAAVGKLFFLKYIPIITFLKDGQSQLTLLKSLNVEFYTHVFRWIFGIFLLMGFVWMIVKFVLQNKYKNDAVYETI